MNLKFVIYRILGNSLPPRHGSKDTYNNLRFILEHEPDLVGCEKRWLLNRLLDKRLEQRCIDLIAAHGQRHDIIPFDPVAYRNVFLDATGMPSTLNPFGAPKVMQANTTPPKRLPPIVNEWILRHKSQALINVNAARNRALHLGRGDADWTLPLDGGCFFTANGWARFTQDVIANPDALYGIIPMARIDTNSQLSDPLWQPELNEEPQIAFRHDAPDQFDENMRYGNRNKVELLVRLDIPGRWHISKPAAWDMAPTPLLKTKDRALPCGWICRLATGADKAVEETAGARFAARFNGVARLAHNVDSALLAHAKRINNQSALHANADMSLTLATLAENRRGKRSGTISDKIEVPPSANPQDYFSIPRYLHLFDGKWQHIDGHSNPAAIIGSAESRRYDRTSLYEFIQSISILTADGIIHGRDDSLKQATTILHCWFIDEKTRMNPHARFAQFDPRTPRQSNFAGLIDFRDLWVLPQLCDRLRAAKALSQEEYAAIQQWTGTLSKYLRHSPQGQAAFQAHNNIGTWSHLLATSLADFSNQYQVAASRMSLASLRLAAQQEPSGRQTREFARTRPLHYSLFNLTAWVLFANFCRKRGVDLWNFRGVEGQSICNMMNFIQTNLTRLPEYNEAPEHFAGWLAALHHLTPESAADRALLGPLPRALPTQWHDDPDTGLPPQWTIFLLPTTASTAPHFVNWQEPTVFA